ncbi:hypothetical protein Q1695_000987 [Nippostrongylus brasiliensis]|nr:hypothetical protein Q1695_000987 [Nippostrongylus brasiliensis]
MGTAPHLPYNPETRGNICSNHNWRHTFEYEKPSSLFEIRSGVQDDVRSSTKTFCSIVCKHSPNEQKCIYAALP